jgi:transcription elongation factor Elf1
MTNKPCPVCGKEPTAYIRERPRRIYFGCFSCVNGKRFNCRTDDSNTLSSIWNNYVDKINSGKPEVE